MTLTPDLVEHCRRQFPALTRLQHGRPVVYLDGPAGTQVPQRVIDAVSDYLAHHNANQCGRFATSRETDAMMHAAHQAVADLLGAGDAETIAFGPNMTTLTFALSRALARTWKRGDEVLVTKLDHDANVTPWVRAAEDAGAIVRFAEIRREDCTLDLEDLRSKLNERTRLVAVGCASNSVGTINPVREITRWAHDAGAEVFLDAVHYVPHALVDVQELGCDYLACSAYKFFAPHVGVLWGRRDRLEELPAYKVRPASDSLPSRWMTGTQNHEGIAGVLAAVEYLAELGHAVSRDDSLSRPDALKQAYAAIGEYETTLVARLLSGLAEIDGVTVYGITDEKRRSERLPTVSLTHARRTPAELAEHLGERGIFAWHGNYYAVCLTEALGLEPNGMLRLGLVHYNTPGDVDRVLAALREIGD
jgi:cysteine desulfurase family protein (TIGR01976 family)